MSLLVLHEDLVALRFEPFAPMRPICTLLAGAETIAARWARATGREATFAGLPALRAFREDAADGYGFDAPRHIAAGGRDTIPAGTVVASSRFVLALGVALTDADRWMGGGETAAIRLARDVPASVLDEAPSLDVLPAGPRIAELPGRWLGAAWDLVATLSDQLGEDIPALAAGADSARGPYTRFTATGEAHRSAPNAVHGHIVGDHPVYLANGVTIEPYVLFDASGGPILIEREATVSAFSRIAGPCFVGRHSVILGERVAACAIGETCRIRGEISNTIVLGHTNKAHAGFVGHSYLGRWVNLGAGTTTSNLKNTYGTVSVRTSRGTVDTGMRFLGTLFGDHAKTGIGTMLTTGTMLGAGANVFGTTMPPKYVPPFAWGDGEPYGVYDVGRFLQVAERVMERRHVRLGEETREQLRAAHASATSWAHDDSRLSGTPIRE